MMGSIIRKTGRNGNIHDSYPHDQHLPETLLDHQTWKNASRL